jgi:L-threonylcarbamoyladenylate synthase
VHISEKGRRYQLESYLLEQCGEGDLDDIADRIVMGDIFIFPSDTVYGIGCSARNQAAVERIFGVKKRDAGKPLPVFVSSVEAALAMADPLEQDTLERLGRAFWPGGVTIVADVVDSGLYVQPSSQGVATSIGFRVPAHDGLLRLLKRGLAIAQTSLNESGSETIKDLSDQAVGVLRSGVDFELDSNRCPEGTSSTVVRVTRIGFKVLREGTVSGADIADVMGGHPL